MSKDLNSEQRTISGASSWQKAHPDLVQPTTLGIKKVFSGPALTAKNLMAQKMNVNFITTND